MKSMKFPDFTCDICGSNEGKKIDFNYFFFPTISHNPNLHQFENFICNYCGVVFVFPQLEDEKLSKYYNSIYRESIYALNIENKKIDTPIKIPGSGVSLQRFKTFYKIITEQSKNDDKALPKKNDNFIDFGAYQGMFLHGVSSVWGCNCIAYDYNEKGIDFAKKALGFKDSFVAKDIYKDKFKKKAKYISIIHAFEHLKYPTRFLRHIGKNVIKPGGYLYLEVPNVYAYPLQEPSHFYNYSIQSLTSILETNGFKVLKIDTTGFPTHSTYLARSNEMYIFTLCKSIVGETPKKIQKTDPESIYKQIKKRFRKLSFFALKNQFLKAFTESVKFFYYFLIVFTEKISYKLAGRITKFIRKK